MKRPLLSLILALSFAATARAGVIFKTSGQPVQLLELYTSEGCSSCPPAEAWLSGLKSNGALWKTVVPVAWHVDYWDRLGWKDPFGARNHSIRQRSEATAVGAGTYTPGFFLNGAEWTGFANGQALSPPAGGDPGFMRATQTAPREFIVEFTPSGACDRPMDVYGALLGFDLSVDVTAGENRGRKLTHDFVLLGSVVRRMDAHNGTYTVRMTLPNYASVDPEKKAAAFWVAPAGGFAALQAIGGFLPEELPDEP